MDLLDSRKEKKLCMQFKACEERKSEVISWRLAWLSMINKGTTENKVIKQMF